MKSCIFFQAAVCLVAVAAISSSDEVVDESAFVQNNEFDHDAHAEAAESIHMMQSQGINDSACKKLAEAAATEVTDAIKARQNTINGLDNGSDCAKNAKSLIDDAKKKQEAADAHAAAKKAAALAAKSAPVDLGTVTLADMTPGKCGTFTNTNAYKQAAANSATADQEAAQAAGAAESAAQAVAAAKKAAARQANRCFCDVKKEMEKEWADVQAATAADAKAWSKAHHMMCVLAGTAPTDCVFLSTPKVSKPTYHGGVHTAFCGREWKTSEAGACPTNCGQSASTKHGSAFCYWGEKTKQVPDGDCVHEGDKPAVPQRSCGATHPCSHWSTSSAPGCGNQHKCGQSAKNTHGSVQCKRVNSGSVVSDSECSHLSKPSAQTRHCPATGACCYFQGGATSQKVCHAQTFYQGSQRRRYINSFSMNSGCNRVTVHDDDEEEEEELLQELDKASATKSAQDVTYYHSMGSLPYDLRNDVRAFTVVPKLSC